MSDVMLVRYGAIPEVSRFRASPALGLTRGVRAVVRTRRGLEIGTVLEHVSEGIDRDPAPAAEGTPPDREAAQEWTVLRLASDDDETRFRDLRVQCEGEYGVWRGRIANWSLNLELIDLEKTLDEGRLILYVLNERGPDCTKLALQSAAAGLGTVEVQPVGADGLMQIEASGGCGSGGCGCTV